MFSKSAGAIGTAPARKNGGQVRSVSMALPDVLMVEMIDADVINGGLEYHPDHGGTKEPIGIWAGPYTNYKGQPKLGWTTGLNNDYIRFRDIGPTNVLNRSAAKNPDLWKLVGANVTVTAVYFEALPYRSGFFTGYSAGDIARAASNMIYKVYLQLSGNLDQGTYRLQFPAAVGHNDYIFVHNGKTTWSSAFKINIFGHRPDDPVKEARLCQWIPGRTNHGRVDIVTEYGLPDFYVIDAEGNEVGGPYPIEEVQGPDDLEYYSFTSTYTASTWQGYGNGGSRRVRNYMSTSDIGTVTAVTAGAGGPDAAGKITFAPGHPFVTGDFVVSGTLSGISGVPSLVRLDNGDGDTFDVYNPLTGTYPAVSGTYSTTAVFGPMVGQMARLITGNGANTFVYRLNYSAFEPVTEGYYRLYIPGWATSDPLYFGSDAWEQLAKYLAAGEYHQRMGCELDGRFGYKRPTALRNGVDCTYYRCRLPVELTAQGSAARGGFPSITTDALLTEVWQYPKTAENIRDAAGEYADAGDWDILSHIHIDCMWDMTLLWRMMTPEQKLMSFGIPKCSDPKLHLGPEYSELDDAPDLVHMMAWALDWMRRCQEEDGGVPSGAYAEQQGRTSLPNAKCWDPPFLWYQQPWTAAPTHNTNFVYAGLAAIYSGILEEVGAPILAGLFRDSAVAAFNFAHNIVLKATIGTTSTAAFLTTGNKTLTVPHGPAYYNGYRVRLESRSDRANNWMEGTINSWTVSAAFTSGPMSITIDTVSPTKTVADNVSLTDWDIKDPNHNRYFYYDNLVEGGLRRRTVVTGDCSSSTAIITNIQPNTDGIKVGDYVTLNSGTTGIVAGTRIVNSIDGPNQVTLRALYTVKDRNGGLLYQPANANNQNATGASLLFRAYGAGLTDTQYVNGFWNAGVESIEGAARPARMFAATCLFRHTNINTAFYRQIAETSHRTGNTLSWDNMGWIEYVGFDGLGPGTGTYTQYFKDVIKESVFRAPSPTNESIVWRSENASNQVWPLMHGGASINGTNTHYTDKNWNVRWNLFWAHITPTQSERDRIIAAHIKHISWIFGMNVQGTAYSTGHHGRYRFRSNLHDTAHIDGQGNNGKGEGPAGIVIFGPDQSTYGIIRDNSWAWGNLNYTGQFSPNYLAGDTDVASRLIEPHQETMPGYVVLDNRWNISALEFGMAGIIQNMIIAAWLSNRGSNVPTNRPYVFT
jgi:hypothetical protein